MWLSTNAAGTAIILLVDFELGQKARVKMAGLAGGGPCVWISVLGFKTAGCGGTRIRCVDDRTRYSSFELSKSASIDSLVRSDNATAFFPKDLWESEGFQ